LYYVVFVFIYLFYFFYVYTYEDTTKIIRMHNSMKCRLQNGQIKTKRNKKGKQRSTKHYTD